MYMLICESSYNMHRNKNVQLGRVTRSMHSNTNFPLKLIATFEHSPLRCKSRVQLCSRFYAAAVCRVSIFFLKRRRPSERKSTPRRSHTQGTASPST